MIKYNFSIKKINSFSMDLYSKYLVYINKINDLYEKYYLFKNKKIPILIIGNGTNIIFLKNFLGVIFINNIKGINIKQDNKYWYLHVSSGENWSNLVLFTIKNNIFGLENLAMIPGKVGAAPIFNIGAYGLEIKDICEYVDILDLKKKK